MNFVKSQGVKVAIPRKALETIFDECDRYDVDETGGRVLGVYRQAGDELRITVTGIIETGPGARRTGTYLKQDGEFQEKVFREIEDRHPDIEHLGNWHTHHVNGYPELSGGDVATYRRTVGHKSHNTDFFYALLVTKRRHGRALERYEFKNYLLRRGDEGVYEIPESDVTLSDEPLVWPRTATSQLPARHLAAEAYERSSAPDEGSKHNRVLDNEVVRSLYPNVKPYHSGSLGLYWRGPVPLVDGSAVEVVVLEQNGGASCTVSFRDPPEPLERAVKAVSETEFASARAALLTTERACNAALYANKYSGKGKKKWTF